MVAPRRAALSLHLIDAPTLVISASDDLIASVGETRTLVDRIPTVIHRELLGGHSLPTESPERWLACVFEFLG